ncbi:MAG TPA: hypothetical protein VNC18_07305 [Gemmatimonadaceae bacterium]|nr:hypothetical protein [Gemmatimonadaceae bacterium]
MRRAGLVACCFALHAAAAQDSLRFSGPDAETSRQVSQIIESAVAAGLPASQIVAKANLAVLVRAPGPRIVETARAVAGRLEVARRSIMPHELPNDIVNAEEALSYNVPTDILRQISKASPKAPIAVPLSVLTQLVVTRVPVDRAGQIVLAMLHRGATPAQLQALGNGVDADVRLLGAAALDAANLRYKNLNPFLAPMPASAANADNLGLSSSPTGPKKP